MIKYKENETIQLEHKVVVMIMMMSQEVVHIQGHVVDLVRERHHQDDQEHRGL